MIGLGALALLAAKWLAQWGLNQLNRRHVQAHAGELPAPYRGILDEETYQKSVAYTLAKARFALIDMTWSKVVLLAVLVSGILPASFAWLGEHWGHGVWSLAAYLLGIGLCMTIPDLPLDWYAQFRLEERFGFNTMTPRLWVLDRIKGAFLAVIMGWPLLALILKTVDWAGSAWWLWAWGAVVAFQWVMLVVAPVWILPWFNKFSPLPDGPLKDRLFALARRAGFTTRSIQVMDGSKRSRHSNAFFTGFGRWRKIVLFDTLVEQLTPEELEAVLAHEIGHYRRRHVLKMVFLSTGALLAGFFAIAWLSRQPAFYQTFGFSGESIVPALLLFSLLGGLVTFWLSPLSNLLSRHWEYEADRFARDTTGTPEPLIGALRKLNEKNLSNLTPHPWYSGFYYSHPTLSERIANLKVV